MKKSKLKEAKKNFRELAKKLPPIQEVVFIGEKIIGSALIKQIPEGEEAIDANKNPIDPDKWYIRKVPQQRYMPHERNLIRAFKNRGDVGVAEYMMKVGKMLERIQAREEAVLEGATTDIPVEQGLQQVMDSIADPGDVVLKV